MRAPNVKARAMAAFATGFTITQAVTEFGISRGTASNWRKESIDRIATGSIKIDQPTEIEQVIEHSHERKAYCTMTPNAEPIVVTVPQLPVSEQPPIDALLYGYVCENLSALRIQARHFSDVQWLTRQNAADLAELHGCLADRAIRILSAVESAHERQQEEVHA